MKQTVHDLRGLRCPMPIVRIFRIMEDLAPGEECVCLADDPAFCADIKAWCRKTGNELVCCECTASGQRVVVRKVLSEAC